MRNMFDKHGSRVWYNYFEKTQGYVTFIKSI